MIVDERVSTKWSGRSRSHYESLGYAFTGHNTPLTVSSLHLPDGSEHTITAECDLCHERRQVPRYAYRDLCRRCSQNKTSTKELKRAGMQAVWSLPGKRESFVESIRRHAPRDPNSVHWKPNKSWQEREFQRSQPEYHQWRRSVYERDQYKCTACGYDRGGILIAHHLNSYADYPDLRLEVSNGVTLCGPCHKQFHAAYGYGRNTRTQFEEFLLRKEVLGWIELLAFSYSPQMPTTPTVTHFLAC